MEFGDDFPPEFNLPAPRDISSAMFRTVPPGIREIEVNDSALGTSTTVVVVVEGPLWAGPPQCFWPLLPALSSLREDPIFIACF